ncbi:hypothetical protein M3Y99_00292700 [Aphelenchoides fujianensis]|nr:hypothetical protein M3Y99_00292700 [Aphelenchoides fujianensis]
MLFFFLLLFHLLQSSLSDASAAYPCIDGRITIAVDISTELSAADFQASTRKQIAFLSNQVFTDEWTNLERLVLVPYNQRAFEQTFTADNTAADVRQQLAQSKQSRPSNLSALFAVLDAWQQQPAESPVHLLVFVSRIDQAAVDASRPSVRSLQQKNYALTFVAVGGQLDAALFYELSPILIPWDVERQNVPAGWTEAFWTAYGKRKDDH